MPPPMAIRRGGLDHVVLWLLRRGAVPSGSAAPGVGRAGPVRPRFVCRLTASNGCGTPPHCNRRPRWGRRLRGSAPARSARRLRWLSWPGSAPRRRARPFALLASARPGALGPGGLVGVLAWWCGPASRAGPPPRWACRRLPPSAALGLVVAVAWCPGRGPPRGGTKMPLGGVFRRCGGGVLDVVRAFRLQRNILRQLRPLPPWPPPPSGGRGRSLACAPDLDSVHGVSLGACAPIFLLKFGCRSRGRLLLEHVQGNRTCVLFRGIGARNLVSYQYALTRFLLKMWKYTSTLGRG